MSQPEYPSPQYSDVVEANIPREVTPPIRQQGENPEADILAEASALITGERNEQYGDAREDFDRQATIWSLILNRHVTSAQVAMCMIATKLCREINNPKHDNRLDMVGYAALLERVTIEL